MFYLLIPHADAKSNKVLPYKASAGIPMIIKWPGKIKERKVIQTAYSSIDFAPTLLNLVGAKNIDSKLHARGSIDASGDLLDNELVNSNPSQMRFIDGPNGRYAAAVSENYKFVLSRKGEPWLIDLKNDHNEYYNAYTKSEEMDTEASLMQTALYEEMMQYEFGLTRQTKSFYLNRPACDETRNSLGDALPFQTCDDVRSGKFNATQSLCQLPAVQTLCPVACDTCVKDTDGKIGLTRSLLSCEEEVKAEPDKYCPDENIQHFCAKTCSHFKPSGVLESFLEISSESSEPSFSPRASGTNSISASPQHPFSMITIIIVTLGTAVFLFAD